MGLGSPLPNYGDMGYAYLLSRFGAPMSIALIVVLFLIPMADDRGVRFRALIVLYIFSNLAISGTSVSDACRIEGPSATRCVRRC